MGWETTFEDGKAGGAKLELQRLNPFLWLINPERKMRRTVGSVVCCNLGAQGEAVLEDH